MTTRTVPEAARGIGRRASLAAHGILALAIYPALLLTKRGDVAADSKQLLFVDAGRFLSRVPYLWDPGAGMGTVTHQNLGYLLPMGPWFWVTEQLGIPVWVSQRLWLGTILFAGAAGVLFLARTLRWDGAGPVVAALAYGLSPYVLQYATHLSVLLLPFGALPWLVALALRSVRAPGWRWPAWFAIAVALSGSVNATALVCVLIAPAVALIVELVTRASPSRDVARAAFRIGALSIAVSLWWMVALAIESGYGLDVLNFTESLETVTLASSAPEMLRGLGYWFFYGRDPVAPYLEAANSYMTSWLVPVSFVPALLAAVAAVSIRWRRRSLFLTFLVVGLVLAVGAHPFDDPSPFGEVFKSILEDFGPARAMRSITRITPLIVLGVAGLLGAGVTALADSARRPTLARFAAAGAALAVALAATPFWRGDAISSTRVRPEEIPGAWRAAAAALDAEGDATRVLELPGIDFAAYDWGYANDSITRGLMDRSTLAREVVPYGTEGSVDLLTALDRRLQEGVFDVAALPVIARLAGIGDVLVRSDLQYRRYQIPSPDEVQLALAPLPPGFRVRATFGEGKQPELTILEVEHPRPIVRSAPTGAPVIVAGSGEGLVDAAEAGVLPDDRLVVYSGSLAERPGEARRLLESDAELVVTDSNRRRALRAKTLHHNYGYTERAGETPLRTDPEDARLDLFPGTTDDARSVAIARGPTARATSYGNPLTLEPTERPMLAIDGDRSTAWRAGGFFTVVGEQLEIDVGRRVTADRVTLLQPAGNRTITRARLTFDGDHAVDVDLGAPSTRGRGQVVRFGERRFRRLTIEVLATDPEERVNNGGLSGVGFAEVTIPGVAPAEELVRLPRDLLDLIGPDAEDHALTLVLTRLRAPEGQPAPEGRIARIFDLPAARTFALTGTGRTAPPGAATTPTGPCRDDLVSVDGRAFPMLLTSSPDGTLALTPCDDTPFVLSAGRHVLRSTEGSTTGIDVDRLVLRSAPGGDAAGAPTSTAQPRSPGVRVHRDNPTTLTLEIREAREPFWLVFGESFNSGWRATRGDTDLGEPLLVDGGVNAWYVDPHGTANLTVNLAWEPQRYVWFGLGISGLALLACVALVLRRQRAPTVVDESDDGPKLMLPWHGDAPVAPMRPSLWAVGGVLVLGTLVIGVVGGALLAAATFIALRVRRGGALPGITAVLALVSAAGFVTVREGIERFPADFPWPASFDEVHAVALAGVLLLAIDALVDRIRSSRDDDSGRAS